MTKVEAITIAQVALTADGGCASCAANLFEQLAKFFPEHLETLRMV